MARAYRFAGELSDLNVTAAVSSSPHLRAYRDRLANLQVRGRAVGPARAQAILERLFVGALDRVGGEYAGRVNAHVDAIGKIRGELQGRFARIHELFAPDAPPVHSLPAELRPAALEPLFGDLDRHIEAVAELSARRGLEDAMAHVDRTRSGDDLLVDLDAPGTSRPPDTPDPVDAPPVIDLLDDQGLGPIQRELDAEREAVAVLRDQTIRTQGQAAWDARRAGATKRLYNLLEARHVLQLQRALPDRVVLGQAEIVGIRTSAGLESIPSGEGRIADWIEVRGSEAQLGDLKSPSAVTGSVEGGLRRNPDLEAEFKSSSEIGRQHANELRILERAQQLGPDARIIVRAQDPATGSTVEIAVEPGSLQPSRITTYGQLLPQ